MSFKAENDYVIVQQCIYRASDVISCKEEPENAGIVVAQPDFLEESGESLLNKKVFFDLYKAIVVNSDKLTSKYRTKYLAVKLEDIIASE